MKLYVNLEVLDSTIAVYQNEINKISESLENLDNLFERIRKNHRWKTEVSEVTLSIYENDLRKKIDENLTLLIHLKDCLVDARDAYYEQFNKAVKLGKEI